MEKNKHIGDKEWEAIAKQLFDTVEDGRETPEISGIDAEILEDVVKTSGQVDLYYKLKKYDPENAWEQVKPQIRTNAPAVKTFRLSPVVMRVAAVILFAVLLTSVGFYVGSKPWSKEKSAGVVVDNYGISRLELPDGSVVTLNHDTKINYPRKFSGNIREVEIEGEAFFEVQPNPNKPFVIHAGEANIKVLGTSFNVNAYPGNNEIEVVVATGKVQVSKKKTETIQSAETTQLNEVILDPGEKGVFVSLSNELRKSRNDNPNFLSWKTRDLIFNKTSLKEVIEQLNKVYRIQIKTDDPQLDQLLLTARFEDRSLDFILKVIALTHGLDVEKENELYVLKKSH